MQCLKKCLTMPKKCFATPLEVSPNTFLEKTMSDAIGERCEVKKKCLAILGIDSESWRESVKGVKTPKKGGV